MWFGAKSPPSGIPGARGCERPHSDTGALQEGAANTPNSAQTERISLVRGSFMGAFTLFFHHLGHFLKSVAGVRC